MLVEDARHCLVDSVLVWPWQDRARILARRAAKGVIRVRLEQSLVIIKDALALQS